MWLLKNPKKAWETLKELWRKCRRSDVEELTSDIGIQMPELVTRDVDAADVSVSERSAVFDDAHALSEEEREEAEARAEQARESGRGMEATAFVE